jgi:hypothetical protein
MHTRRIRLLPHPATPCAAVRTIEVEIVVDGGLSIAWHIDADVQALRLPPVQPPQRRDGLWRSTCCELFVRGAGEAYREFNFSPSGEWAAYAFDGYRAGMRECAMPAPRVLLHTAPGRVVLEARLDAIALAADDAATLRAGLCCVIEAADGRLSYWALAHPAARPDFHHAGGFALDLAATMGASSGPDPSA